MSPDDVKPNHETAAKTGKGLGPLPCYRLNRGDFPTERPRTILLCGVARSGTSFVGSVAGNLGVPFRRPGRDKVSGHWEHVALREAFKAKNAAAFEAIVAEFNQAHPIWAWKLPSMKANLDWVACRVRNPCFVFTFKEPLSVAMRKVSTGHLNDLSQQFEKIFNSYAALIKFAGTTDRPVMLVSYDKAVRQLDECIEAIARYSGVEKYDASAVKTSVLKDGERY